MPSRTDPAPETESLVPRWPIVVGAIALVMVVAIAGYAGGLLFPGAAERDEPALAVEAGILAEPAGAPEQEPSEEPTEEPSEEPAHPAGLDPAVTYVLQNGNGGRVLDVVQAATANGSPVHLWDRHDGVNQQWRFVPVEGGFYEIEAVGAGKLLEIPTAADAGPGAALLTRTGQPNQQWSLVEVGPGVVRIVNRATGQALEGRGGAPDNGTPVTQAADAGQAHQQWRLLPLS
ncbi:RICIN domain-containing protein [Nocardiopsis sp. NPDC050513]|uniref:RICIN domain-containing protein n=1 Tax=Nocardiopsis sp. NPDC050513 TaxID=3364338 RepID=UPI0037AD8376